MSIDGIKPKKPPYFDIDLPWPQPLPPIMHQPLPHAPGPQLLHLPQPPKDTQLIIRHAHIRLVRLHIVARDGLQLRGRGRVDEFVEDGELEVGGGPADEGLEVGLGDAADRVEVRAGAVVFGQVPA